MNVNVRPPAAASRADGTRASIARGALGKEGAGDSERSALRTRGVDVPRALERAQAAYELNRRRAGLLGCRLLADPAWNILLDLFIAAACDRELSVSAVCIGSHAPAATALRYISLLNEGGLVERSPDVRDGRRTFLSLTDRGWSAMVSLLVDERTA